MKKDLGLKKVLVVTNILFYLRVEFLNNFGNVKFQKQEKKRPPPIALPKILLSYKI
ncbi:MAG: hypothetical protein KGZ86_07205 [Candidatus Latescibacteria bacterium]|nr:hypothetical protein [Candidatus Latescibacterota bacterium]